MQINTVTDLLNFAIQNKLISIVVLACVVIVAKWAFTNPFLTSIFHKFIDSKKERSDKKLQFESNINNAFVESSTKFLNETLETNKYLKEISLDEIRTFKTEVLNEMRKLFSEHDMMTRMLQGNVDKLKDFKDALEVIKNYFKGGILVSKEKAILVARHSIELLKFKITEDIIKEKYLLKNNQKNDEDGNFEIYISDITSKMNNHIQLTIGYLNAFTSEYGRIGLLLHTFVEDENIGDVIAERIRKILYTEDNVIRASVSTMFDGYWKDFEQKWLS